MSGRYERLPNPSDRHPHHDIDDEVEAAFDYREDDDDNEASESQPLNRNASSVPAPHARSPSVPTHTPGSYNFEIVDYDFPPPGSPPPPTAQALPNDFGNSNGVVPDFNSTPVPQPRRPWWKHAASTVLPDAVASRLGVGSSRPSGVIGGGTNNDGVFANVTAKPSAPGRVQTGEDGSSYVVPEDAQNEAPPSYAAAQADAVPPYWETTIHAPFASDSIGEMIVDSLPTGSLFSFCWNMLVSISFQFVGFLLTYLLHTSHAARLGSRAGLGVTLIQYGFALRGKLDGMDGSDTDGTWGGGWRTDIPADPTATSIHASWSDPVAGLGNATETAIPSPDDQIVNSVLADATAEWLSFFLMTIGWFVLLTSVLGFYRVKRWERSILAGQQRESGSAIGTSPPATAASAEDAFAIRGMSRIELLRSGFGLSPRQRERENSEETRGLAQAESSPNTPLDGGPEVLDPNDPRHQEIARNRRFVNALRNASLI